MRKVYVFIITDRTEQLNAVKIQFRFPSDKTPHQFIVIPFNNVIWCNNIASKVHCRRNFYLGIIHE
jgi:hypothetical protein